MRVADPPTVRRPVALLPREHGAWAQFFLPIATGLAAAEGRAPAWLVAVAVSCAFLAHEPLVVLLGHRGLRRLAEDGVRARRRVGTLVAVGLVAALGGVWLGAEGTLQAFAAPVLGAMVLVPFVWTRSEKSGAGEVVAAVTMALASVPVARAGGAEWNAALGLALAWGAGMTVASLGVRVVLARAKRRPAGSLLVALAVAGVAIAGAAWLAVRAGEAPSLAMWSVAPLVVTGVALGVHPPAAKQLRATGFAILGAGVLTLAGLFTSLGGW